MFYLFCFVNAVVVVDGYLVHPYRVVVGDPLGQEAPEILGTNARGHLVKLLLGPYGAREHAGWGQARTNFHTMVR